MKNKKMTAERAAQIVNDIHEGMCKASRKELMECASFYAVRSGILYSSVINAYAGLATHAFGKINQFKQEWDKKDKDS